MTTHRRRILRTLLAAVCLLTTFCTTAQCGDDLYAPRFEKLNDQQRALLRECLAGQKKLTELYANYKSKGTYQSHGTRVGAQSYPFEYMQRADGYALLKAPRLTVARDTLYGGTLVTPQGFVTTRISTTSQVPIILNCSSQQSDGINALSSRRFTSAPTTVVVWEVLAWLTEKKLHPQHPHDNNWIATDLTVSRNVPNLGDIAKLSFAFTHKDGQQSRITVELLMNYLWAVKHVEKQSIKSGPWQGGEVTEIEYNLDTPHRPHMARLTFTEFRLPSDVPTEDKDKREVFRFDDYEFEEIEFVKPDVKEFSLNVLGLPNWYFLYIRVHMWQREIAAAAAVVVIFALIFIIRQRPRMSAI